MVNNYPYMGMGYQSMAQKSQEQLNQEMQMLQQKMSEYQNMVSQFNNGFSKPQTVQPLPQNSGLTSKGQFIGVTSIDEVTDAPTALDGSATLFIDFKNKVFWSKKFVSGSHQIQAYKYEPINVASATVQAEETIDFTKELENMEILEPNNERIDKLEEMMKELLNRIPDKKIISKTSKPITSPTSTIKEIVKNEI